MNLTKNIVVDGEQYVLSIDSLSDGGFSVNMYLKRDPSIYSDNKFLSLGDLKTGLKRWIVTKHQLLNNDEKKEVFRELEEWDGVIHIE